LARPAFAFCRERNFTVPTALLQPSLTVYDVAGLFKTSHKTVRRMIADGTLPAMKIGAQWRIRPEVVAEMLGASA
jgi:excisionase family DNA binding protein